MMNNQEAVDLVDKELSAGKTAEQACFSLIEEASARWHDAEGDYRDDITAVVIRLPLFPSGNPDAALATVKASSSSGASRASGGSAAAAAAATAIVAAQESQDDEGEEWSPLRRAPGLDQCYSLGGGGSCSSLDTSHHQQRQPSSWQGGADQHEPAEQVQLPGTVVNRQEPLDDEAKGVHKKTQQSCNKQESTKWPHSAFGQEQTVVVVGQLPPYVGGPGPLDIANADPSPEERERPPSSPLSVSSSWNPPESAPTPHDFHSIQEEKVPRNKEQQMDESKLIPAEHGFASEKSLKPGFNTSSVVVCGGSQQKENEGGKLVGSNTPSTVGQGLLGEGEEIPQDGEKALTQYYEAETDPRGTASSTSGHDLHAVAGLLQELSPLHSTSLPSEEDGGGSAGGGRRIDDKVVRQ
ncbi:unnamed protein product [Heterosigma akashiwo]